MNSLLAVVSLILLIVVGCPAAAQGAAPPQAELPEQIAPYLKPQRLVRNRGRAHRQSRLSRARLANRRPDGRAGWLVAGMEPIQPHFHAGLAFVRGIPPDSDSVAQAPSRRTPFTKPKISNRH